MTLTLQRKAQWGRVDKQDDVLIYHYDTIEEVNVDSKAECNQLNLAEVARKKSFFLSFCGEIKLLI